MQSSRVALIVAAVALAVVAFVVLAPGGEDEDGDSAPVAEEAEPAGEGRGEAENGGRQRPEGRRGKGGPGGVAPVPLEGPVIEIEDGGVTGGVETIEASRGERIEFAVASDAPDEIHVHGYEITRDVEPGEPSVFSFPADLEGIYEVEAHDIGHVVIAELRVTP